MDRQIHVNHMFIKGHYKKCWNASITNQQILAVNRNGYKEQNAQLWCLNCKAHDVRALGWHLCNSVGLSLRLRVSCHSFQHLLFTLPHLKAGNVSGGKKRLSSQNDCSLIKKRKSFQEPPLQRLSFLSHWPEPMRWAHRRPVTGITKELLA